MPERPGGALEAIGPVSEAVSSDELRSVESVATPDLSHLLFWDNVEGMWPSLIGEGEPVYEYVGRNNSRPFMVDVEGGEGSTKTIGDCTSSPGDTGRTEDRCVFICVVGGWQDGVFRGLSGR